MVQNPAFRSVSFDHALHSKGTNVSEKAKWAGIYLLVCSIPFFFYFLPPLSPDVISHKAVANSFFLVPYAGLILVAFLGWQVNQTRIFWTALFLLAFYFYLRSPGFVITETGRIETLQIVSVAYPFALCVIFLLKESRLWGDLSLARFLLALSPLLFLICLLSWAQDLYQKIMFWAPTSPAQGSAIPRLAWVATGLFLLVVTYLYDPKVKNFLAALMTTFMPFLFIVQVCLLPPSQPARVPTSFHIVVAFTTITLILLHALLRMYWQKVYLDPLTAVSNRQAMDERLHTLHGEFALAMVDIDHFKKFNDTYGHSEGDNVLRMVAQHLAENLGDRVYRYGGEEFCVVFEKTEHETALEMMEKTRAALEKRKFTLRGQRKAGYSPSKLLSRRSEGRGKKVHITFSVGVASTTKAHRTPEEVIKRADHALYEAKEKGRNRVVSDEK